MGRKRKPPVPVPLVVAIPPGAGELPAGPPLAQIRETAIAWARENGLTGELDVTGPELVKYPKQGHGYVVILRERSGGQRMATARMAADGKPNYWTMDGRTF